MTHGHLTENDNHGGAPDAGLPDARDMLDGSRPTNVDIKGYIYGKGDLEPDRRQRPAARRPRRPLAEVHQLGRDEVDDAAGLGLPHDHGLQAAL